MARQPYHPPSVAAPQPNPLALPPRGQRRPRSFSPLRLADPRQPAANDAPPSDPLEEARRAALAEGHAEGFAQGQAAAQEQHAELLARLQESAEQAARLRDALVEVYRRELVELAVEVAANLAGEALAQDVQGVRDTIQRALDRLGSDEPLVLTLCPADADRLSEWLDALRDSGHDINVVQDERLTPGDVRLRCASGSIDHVLTERVARVRRALVEPAVTEAAPP